MSVKMVVLCAFVLIGGFILGRIRYHISLSISRKMADEKNARYMEERKNRPIKEETVIDEADENAMYSDAWYDKARKREGIGMLVFVGIVQGLVGYILFSNLRYTDIAVIKNTLTIIYLCVSWGLLRIALCKVFGRKIWVSVVSKKPNVDRYNGDTKVILKVSDGRRSWRKMYTVHSVHSFNALFGNRGNKIAMYELGTIHLINWAHRQDTREK